LRSHEVKLERTSVSMVAWTILCLAFDFLIPCCGDIHWINGFRIRVEISCARFSTDEDNIAVKLSGKMIGETPGLTLTNLGRLDFPERYGDLSVDRFIIAPSTGPFLKMVVGAVTAAGRLSVTVNYIEEVTEQGLMEDIRDRVMKLLQNT